MCDSPSKRCSSAFAPASRRAWKKPRLSSKGARWSVVEWSSAVGGEAGPAEGMAAAARGGPALAPRPLQLRQVGGAGDDERHLPAGRVAGDGDLRRVDGEAAGVGARPADRRLNVVHRRRALALLRPGGPAREG